MKPPSTRHIASEDFIGDWAKDKEKFLFRLNKFVGESVTGFTGGLRLADNLGGQVLNFTVSVPPCWIAPSLQGGVTNVGGSNETAGYFKDDRGIVHVKGVVVGVTNSATIFTLPVGYRPAEHIQVATAVSSGADAYARLEILNTGVVDIKANASTYASLRVSFECSDLSPGIPTCWPVRFKSTLQSDGGLCATVLPPLVVDVTPGGGTGVPFTGGTPLFSNQGGYISIDYIPGLVQGRTYKVTAIALPG